MNAIETRLHNYKCLRCDRKMFGKDGPVAADTDPNTGFPHQHCKPCRDWLKAHPSTPSSETAAKFNERHRAEGIANLDRLLGEAQ